MPSRSDCPSLDSLRAVFLDRDGVINKKAPEGQYVHRWEDFELLPSVPEAIARLNRAGLRVFVASNQRGIALGLYSIQDVVAIHDALQRELNRFGAHIDGYYVCPHDKRGCDCRKPLPGLFHQAAEEFPEITASSSVAIGDSLSDMEFGRRLGMFTIYVESDLDSREQDCLAARSLADVCCRSLADAVEILAVPE
jgi:D-glycero-D-manno-heptose 1,7-bisphosphate phosphatase